MHQLKTRKPLRNSTITAPVAVEAEVKTTVYSPPPMSTGVEGADIEKPRLMVGPLASNGEIIDITHDVVEVIAREIWKRSQGNDLLNWIEAERLFQETMQSLRPSPELRHETVDRHGR